MVSTAALFLVPIGFAGVAGALASGFTQTKGFVSFKVLKPKPNTFNPLPKLKRMFLSKEAATNLLQSAGKVVVIAGFTFQYFWQEMQALVQVGSKTPAELLSHLGGVMLQLGIRVVALLIVFAAIDFVLQHRRMEKEMRMSKHEVKEEHKQSDGDPMVKRRQRQIAREMANRQMLGNVAKADVVVVNPTHYAVALAYDTAKMPAPQVTAKGKDALAAKIRDIARKNRVPVVHNPPLARALHAEVKVGGIVPVGLYGAVAEVLAYVYKLRRRLT
jgi:flagellar biosynthetic protein FlhB